MGRNLLISLLLLLVGLVPAKVCMAQVSAAFSSITTQGCSPLVVSFQSQSQNAVQWKWNLGNGTISFLQHPSATYFNPGSFTVTLIVTDANGLKDTLIKPNYITVHPNPAVQFVASNTSGCFPLAVQFTDLSNSNGTSATYNWDFGDGTTSTNQNPQHIYPTAGLYNVTLIVRNSFGCVKTLTKQNYITISAGVTASFTNAAPAACVAPQTVSFTNTSTGTGALTYLWFFGDGNTSTALNPSHSYTANGNYTVRLIVRNATGCTDTITKQNLISLGANNPAFTMQTTACKDEAITFTNTSSPSPTAASWSFGDGTTSSAISPVKSYAAPGTYTVKLVVSFGNCLDSLTKTITILPKPNTSFVASPLAACQPTLSVNFTNQSTNSVASFWDFGDGTTSTLNNPSHVFNSYGSFTVMLITTNANGCKDTLVKPDYIVIQKPFLSFNNLPQQGCAPFTWTFGATVNSVTPVQSYSWSFGDGTTSTSVNPTHTFSAGLYDIQLIITTAGGCSDTIRMAEGIKVSVKPTAGFFATPLDVCAKDPIQFTDTSHANITSWLWQFGDGSTSTQMNPLYAYSDTGYFSVTLIVGSNGCYDTIRKINYVHVKPPIAVFEVVQSCSTKYLKTFVDRSIGADTWYWTFGDGSSSTQQNPTHTYANTGTYTVKLFITNAQSGCDNTSEQIVYVADELAQFTANITQLCKGTEAVFIATSIQAQPLIVSYIWDFGDGSTGTGANVSHVYDMTGIYTVKLDITDVNGCTDSKTRFQYVKIYGPDAEFMSGMPGACLNSAVTFDDLSSTDGIHPITSWDWNWGDGNISIGAVAPFVHTYGPAGIYSVVLTVTDSYGCKDTMTKVNLITISAPEANFSVADTNSCPGANINFVNNSTGPSLTYAWNFGDGNISAIANPSHRYTANGTYVVKLVVTDIYNCVSSKTQIINVVTPTADFSVSDSTSTCPPLIVNFTSNAQHVYAFVWDFGNGNTSIANNPTHFYNVAGNYNASLTVTGPGGCVAVKTKPIRISGPRGSFNYAPLEGCSPLTVNFRATTLARSSFVWDFNDGTTVASTDSIISHTYTLPGIYVPKMILRDVGGCSVAIIGLDTIRVNGVMAKFSTDTLTRCNSGSIQFINETISNQAIDTYLWNFGDGTTSTQQSPQHFYAGLGNYTVSLRVTTVTGCVDDFVLATPIRVMAAPIVTAAISANGCVPVNMSFSGNFLGGDSSAISWKWTTNNGNAFMGKNPLPVPYTTAGSYSYQLLVTNSFGCSDTAIGNFEVYGLPNVSAGNDLSICQNTGKILQATGASTYIWSPSAGLSCATCATPTATPDSAKKYTVIGTDINGCRDTSTVNVQVVYPFKMTPGKSDTLCIGESSMLGVNGAATYVWSPSLGLNTITGNRVMARPDNTTLYRVVGSDAKTCFKDTVYFPVQVYPYPKVKLFLDTTVVVGNNVTLTPTLSPDVTNVIWNNPVGLVSTNYPSIVVHPTGPTQYNMTAYNEGGCTSTARATIYVTCGSGNIFIPNTFSPNADGNNDVFFVRGTGLYNIKSLRVFNRWGEMIFSRASIFANDASVGWNGTYKGLALNSDVYVYVIEVQCENNETLMFKGDITLIK